MSKKALNILGDLLWHTVYLENHKKWVARGGAPRNHNTIKDGWHKNDCFAFGDTEQEAIRKLSVELTKGNVLHV